MFFPRLRNQAKWVFVFLVVVFGGGFVFLGVGSGGLDLGQLLRDAFGNQGSSGGSVSQAQDEVSKHPAQAAPYKKLATALEQSGRIGESITALQQYTTRSPKDTDALQHLAQLELGQAETFLGQAQTAYAQQQSATAGSTFVAPASSTLGQAFGQDPVSTALSTKFGTELQQATTAYQTASSQAIATYQQLVKIQPKNEQAVFQLAQAAESFGESQVAIGAYKRLLKLTDDETTKTRVSQRIKALQKQSKASSGG